MDYVLIKQVHMSFAVISISGFILRWAWKINHSPLSSHRLARTAPHVIDTLFLASGITLAFSIGQYPLSTPWLTAKIAGLLAYIVLGMLAMSGGIPRTGRITAFTLALFCYCWIISVARLKSPWGFFSI